MWLARAGRPSKLGTVPPPPLAQRIALGMMHPALVARPFHHEGWVYEEKVDGYRMAAMKTGDGARLISRNGIHHSNRYRALVQVLTALSAASFLLDGEIAIYDQALVSRFEWLRSRPKDALATEPVYMVFDLLELGGEDLRGLPLWQRRNMLEALVTGQRAILPVRRLSSDGLKAWEQALHRGYEGIVGKDPESLYVPGRTLRWLKVKQKDYRKEARGFDRE
jgi:bifunctional non-homologous end joining protein LigD